MNFCCCPDRDSEVADPEQVRVRINVLAPAGVHGTVSPSTVDKEARFCNTGCPLNSKCCNDVIRSSSFRAFVTPIPGAIRGSRNTCSCEGSSPIQRPPRLYTSDWHVMTRKLGYLCQCFHTRQRYATELSKMHLNSHGLLEGNDVVGRETAVS